MSYRTHNGKPDKDILCEQVCLCAFIICACVPVCVSVSLLLRGHLKDITVFLISLFFFSVSSSQHQTFLRMANLTPWLATMSSTDQRFCLCDTLNTNNPPTIQKKKKKRPTTVIKVCYTLSNFCLNFSYLLSYPILISTSIVIFYINIYIFVVVGQ